METDDSGGDRKYHPRQRYPWNGLVDLSFTVTGESDETYDVSFTAKDVVGNTNLTIETLLDAKGLSVSVSDPVMPGTYRWIWNAAADLPDGFKCDRVTVTGTVEEHLGGVQLWENGPYWAECNVGATKPEESGYYFWWGDTVGYKRNSANDGWVQLIEGCVRDDNGNALVEEIDHSEPFLTRWLEEDDPDLRNAFNSALIGVKKRVQPSRSEYEKLLCDKQEALGLLAKLFARIGVWEEGNA